MGLEHMTYGDIRRHFGRKRQKRAFAQGLAAPSRIARLFASSRVQNPVSTARDQDAGVGFAPNQPSLALAVVGMLALTSLKARRR